MINDSFAQEIGRFFQYFVNELKLTNKYKNTIISYNTTIKSFIEFIKQYDKKLNFDK